MSLKLLDSWAQILLSQLSQQMRLQAQISTWVFLQPVITYLFILMGSYFVALDDLELLCRPGFPGARRVEVKGKRRCAWLS